MTTCPNCRGRPTIDHRGLCRVCVACPEVRRRFFHSLATHRGHGINGGTMLGQDGRPLPPDALRQWQPTKAMPGTEAKVAVMEERASLGLPLFHPQDACDSLYRCRLVESLAPVV